MARTKGMLNLSGNLEVNAGAPLDARSVVPTVADLTVASNFQYKYVGMTVTVQATGDMYTLLTNDVTDIANWKKVGSGGGSSYTAGDGIDLTNDEISVKAGSNLSFDSSGNLNATDTTYTAGDGIVIDNDEISTDNMPAADMAEIVTPLPSVMSRYRIYSEDEQIVAYWKETVNGVTVMKTVFEKTINFGALPNAASKNVNHNISNLDKVMNIMGVAYSSSYPAIPLPYASTIDNENILLLVTPTQVQVVTGINRASLSAYVTIQYTKTTD